MNVSEVNTRSEKSFTKWEAALNDAYKQLIQNKIREKKLLKAIAFFRECIQNKEPWVGNEKAPAEAEALESRVTQ